jgi:nitroreductase
MNADDLHDLMRARRSIRRFASEAPPRALLEKVLEAAVTAPSASNKQPWRFFIVQSRNIIDEMAAAVRAATDRIAAHVPVESQPSFRAYGDYFVRFERAPVVIVPICRGPAVLSHLVDADLGPDDRRRIAAMERDSALIGASLALENLLLMAHACGLGASGMTGPLVAVDDLAPILNVPSGWQIVALVPIGYPAEEAAPTGRKPLDKVIRWIP